jgi:hypothetical protein
MTLSEEDVAEALPATSVWAAVTVHVPSVNVVRSQFPVVVDAVNEQVAVVVPSVAVTVTLAFVSRAARVMFGVVSPVVLSELEVPVFEAVARARVVGAAGAVVSMTMASAPAMLFAPEGTVVLVIEFPAVSCTETMEKLDTVRSAELWPAATV